MGLSPGTRLGPYEILSPLGAGGMGEVYRARDTRLSRDVAVKVLPEKLSASPEVRQRFEREAQTISQLSHPHICALYDVGNEGGREYLVMELLEGDTLADRLARGPLNPDQTLRFGTEIADALDKAHRRGIVHRDLKPGNVMLTKSGVKLLDFGLAKSFAPERSSSSLTALPTQQGLTQEGTILGTFRYMAPEQLEGREADARTDIFALGATLYEMATGRKAFSGASQASLISSIMTAEPLPISKVQPSSPPALERIVRTCLAKDPEERWQSAADIKRELNWIVEGAGPDARVAPPSARRAWLPWAIAAASALLASLALTRGHAPAPAPRMELSIVPPESTSLTDFFALSPDGRSLAYSAISGGKWLVRVRDLATGGVRALAGTDSSETVFWSPDARSLAFVSRGKLRRMDVATGSIEILADAESGRGGTWGPRGEILFAQKPAGAIYRVPASGGTATAVTTFEKGDLMHRWPQFLPDGERFLFFAKTDSTETTGTYLASVGKPGRKLVLRNGATGIFVAPDMLLYCRNSALLAQKLDPSSGELSGAPETLTRPVMRAELGSFTDNLTASAEGILVFRSGSADRQLTWIDRRGNVVGKLGEPGVIMSVTLSPDGREAATAVRTVETGAYTSSIVDVARNVTTPILQAAAMPVWSADGRTLIYRREGRNYEIWRRNAHGDPKDEAVGLVGPFATPHSISPDGRHVLYSQMGSNFDIMLGDLGGTEKPVALLHSEFDERTPHFSPDGRWFTYSSDEPGENEIFVRRFPMTEEAWRVSTAGGQQPTWSPDGKEIFFVSLDGRFMAAPVSVQGSALTVGPPQTLFHAPVRLSVVANQYAVSADGQRFLVALPVQDLSAEAFRILLNWRH
jgi:serine/threonine protein kinase/Tol biopolymer transport system component